MQSGLIMQRKRIRKAKNDVLNSRSEELTCCLRAVETMQGEDRQRISCGAGGGEREREILTMPENEHSITYEQCIGNVVASRRAHSIRSRCSSRSSKLSCRQTLAALLPSLDFSHARPSFLSLACASDVYRLRNTTHYSFFSYLSLALLGAACFIYPQRFVPPFLTRGIFYLLVIETLYQ